ncbi:MAG: sugar nucleotide-binding protein, partial [Flavobacterium sp.]|uniref:SDR family oxidoreductase n=1 Tax=Flavobacterium sp. TaxID=239 RepID=UPI002FCC0F41
MKILITGRHGQLGSELNDLKESYPHHQMVFVDRDEMDLSNPDQIIEVLDKEKPEIIVSAGAYTAVDKAESDQELCDAVNHIAIKTIGAWATDNNANVIHISTDYVF